ncbi:low temperature requirement protein A [Micromonospora sp. BQ11]|uniref:low temperature requirement protein A n=1 Tax=Micromonospora sp. BQ11 TaxID=3452212 RepID=UPI003F892F3D
MRAQLRDTVGALEMLRIYFYRAGEVLAGAIPASADSARLARTASYAHLVMVAGVVVAAVGDELVAHPLGHTPLPASPSAPAMVPLPPLMVAAIPAVVLTGIAISDAARARGRPPEMASPPRLTGVAT